MNNKNIINIDCNLNIHYSLPDYLWEKIAEIYTLMPNYLGRYNNIPYWFGKDGDEIYLCASVEPSGLKFEGNLVADIWEFWIDEFKRKASDALEYSIGEPEEGYDFLYM